MLLIAVIFDVVSNHKTGKPKEETMLYIGVDLGTSAVKLLLMDGSGCHPEDRLPGVSHLFPAPRLV